MNNTKALLFIFCSLFLVFSFLPSNIVVNAQSIFYGRIISDNAFFYTEPSLTSENAKKFVLPKTYFTKLLANTNEFFFKANYLGIDGYVLKSDVRCTEDLPLSPFASNISFRVFAQNGLILRSSPSTINGMFNKVATIPFLDSNLQYIGKIEAEEAVSHRGNEWYFCKYFKNDEEFVGYVYSGYCDMLTPIKENTENVNYILSPNFDDETVQTSTVASESQTQNNTKWIYIALAISLPSIFILFLIFKPSRNLMQAEKKLNANSSKPIRPKIKHNKHHDYYEIEN